MRAFDLLIPLTMRARESKAWLVALNLVLGRVIPFNRPHGFGIESIGEEFIRTRSRYRKSNLNHIRGIHACAIATIAEFSAGYLLLTHLDPTRYRLIMSNLEVQYLYQAKEDIFSESRFSRERMEAEVVEPLEEQELVTVKMESRVFDASGNDIALAHTTWQIKKWDKVKTKI
jgi:acyl-coenzyme A thioesterase PaaI-like protein